MISRAAKQSLMMRASVLMILLAGTAMLAGCSDTDPIAAPLSPTVDTAPPSIPTGLSAATGSRVVKLAWQPNTSDADFVGFKVYRLAFDNQYLLTEQPITDSGWVDQQPLGLPCGYAVSAIDEAGNESAWSEVRYTPEPEEPQIDIQR